MRAKRSVLSQQVTTWLQGTDKTAKKKTNMKSIRKNAPPWSGQKKNTGGLKHV